MKIIMKHQTFEKVGNKWILLDDFGTKEITRNEYDILATEKWSGDRRSYGYTCIGYVVEKLVNIEPAYKNLKSVRTFDFITE